MSTYLLQPRPEFRDAQGCKVHAAFTLVRITDALLERVEEHDAFSIETLCQPAGRAQHYSQRALRVHGQLAARVEMLSAFVRRAGVFEDAVKAREIVAHVFTCKAATSQLERTPAWALAA